MSRRGRMAAGIVVSCGLHLLILLLLFPSQRFDGHSLQTGYSVGGKTVGKDDADQVEIWLVTGVPETAPPKPPVPPVPSLPAPLQPQTARPQATKSEDRADIQGPKPADGGTGDQTLLAQLARCLPPDVHPALTTAFLDLNLDDKGVLSAVPRMEIDLDTASPADIRAANSVIQAALQCGPYIVPDHKAGQFKLVPDFSALTSAQGAGASATGR